VHFDSQLFKTDGEKQTEILRIFDTYYDMSYMENSLNNSKNLHHWLVKSEPEKYSWEKFNKDGRTFWDGVRNYQARNNLKAMQEGDLVLYYHSNEGKEVVGIAKVAKPAYQDPTTSDPNWVVVDLVPVEPLKKPVTLAQIKAEQSLQDIHLVRQGRLSVISLKPHEFDRIIEMGS
jgi:predicted RNA-binding protein with PUA-like domain